MSQNSTEVSIVIITKDDPDVTETISHVLMQAAGSSRETEILVIDASKNPPKPPDGVRWLSFSSNGDKATIPEQRNLGIRRSKGDVIVFIDSGCVPADDWLSCLLLPLYADGEDMVAGSHRASGASVVRNRDAEFRAGRSYLLEAPTINLAVRKGVFDRVGGFDETFGYGSDVDFTWRASAASFRIRYAPEAIVSHDWGTLRADLRRSWIYGQARFRLYQKHVDRRKTILKNDPVAIVYPVFLGVLLVTRGNRYVSALALVPLAKNARHQPFVTTAHNFVYGAGVLVAAARALMRRASRRQAI